MSVARGSAIGIGRALVALAALLVLALPGPASAQIPDPGGNAEAFVPVPAPGKLFGFNDAMVRPAGVSSPQLMGLARTAGANSVRAVLNWQAIEQTRNGWTAFTWSTYDAFYRDAVNAGMTPVMVLGNAPWWARDLLGKLCLSNHTCAFPPRPAMDGEWAQFAAEAARRFPQAIFEIWNEPNHLSHWASGPSPHRYARLQIVAYDAIKQVNPQAKVLSGGFANLPSTNLFRGIAMREFVAKAYAAGLKGHADALAFHPYPGAAGVNYTGPPPNLGPGSGYARGFADIRAVRDAAGDSGTPLFVTETGISTTEGVDRATQLSASRRIYRKTASMNDVMGVIFHRLIEPLGTQGSIAEPGFAWLRAGYPYPPPPFPVFCGFTADAGNSYPGC